MITAHPGLPEVDYIRPASLAEASKLLAEKPGEVVPFMGGTDLFVRMRDGFGKAQTLVDVKGLEGVGEIHYSPAEGLTVGAAVPMNRVIQCREIQDCYPLLAEAARTVASYQLRSRATIVGNICNASPAGDTTGACLVLGGVLTVHGVDGIRQEPLATFFKGPGKTVLRPGDIVTAIHFPPLPDRHGGRYIKLGRNKLSDLAIVGVTAYGQPDSSLTSGYRFRVALASVAPTPLLVREVETILGDQPVSEGSIASAAQAAMDACSPIDDVRGSARYRKAMVRNLTRKALTEVWDKLKPAA